MQKIITLPSDQKPISVRVLGPFELYDVAPEIPGNYTYTVLTLTGELLTVEYDLRNPELKDNPPMLPDNVNPEPNSYDWHQLKRWHIHQAALLHEKTRLDAFEQYQQFIASYILNTCLSDDNKGRIATSDDYDTVYHTAIVPQLGEGAIEAELTSFFQGFIRWPVNTDNVVFGEPQIQG